MVWADATRVKATTAAATLSRDLPATSVTMNQDLITHRQDIMNLQGRFVSVDPLLASAKTINPQTLNRYSYALNNPLRITDPTGMSPEDDEDESVPDHRKNERRQERKRKREQEKKKQEQKQDPCAGATLGCVTIDGNDVPISLPPVIPVRSVYFIKIYN